MSTTPMNSAAASHVEVGGQPQQRASRKKYGKCSMSKLLSTAGLILALLLIVGAIYMHLKQKTHHGRLNIELTSAPAAAEVRTPLLSEDCLECIAATATAGKPAMCGSSPCSVYRISRPYWQDAMRKMNAVTDDYESCVSNPDCATETVQSFITSYARDCDGDGKIRCRDHIMLHQLGPTGCLQQPLAALSESRMSDCLRVKELE